MVKRKEMAVSNAVRSATSPPPLQRVSKLPRPLPFVLATVLSLFLSTILYSLRAQVLGASDLATVSRSLNIWWQPAASLLWRTVELGVAWYNNYDDYDLASLVTISRAPALYLLYAFYDISPGTVYLSLAIDVVSVWLPTYLLRSRLPSHDSGAPESAVPNSNVIHNTSTTIYTALLPAAVYASTVAVALKTFLPAFLIVHFDGLRSLEAAHVPQLWRLFVALIPLGYAAQKFLFTPSLGAQKNLGDIASEAFNPATATLGETIEYNFLNWSKRVRVLAGRCTVLSLFVVEHTAEKLFGTVEGADLIGSLGYGAVWAVAGFLTGGVYGWIGNV